jgi:uncharacterized protein GlcG (DUF336 family)
MADITSRQAEDVLTQALVRAEQIDTLMNVAIVDAGGNLKAFSRMDGAWLGSIDIALKKARTARFFDMNSGELGSLSQPGGPLFNIEVSNNGLITFPGGIPLRDVDGQVIGGIGVSGSTDDGGGPRGAVVLGRRWGCDVRRGRPRPRGTTSGSVRERHRRADGRWAVARRLACGRGMLSGRVLTSFPS